jgi:hypothetical protein
MNVYSDHDIVIRQSANIIYIDNALYYQLSDVTYTDAIVLTKWYGVYYCQQKPIAEVVVHGSCNTVTISDYNGDCCFRFVGEFKEIVVGKKPSFFAMLFR